MSNTSTLAERRNDLTRDLILQAAVELLEKGPVHGLTIRAAAHQAQISERTVFRYFASRDEFLDAVAQAVSMRLELPAPPESLAALLGAPRSLYQAFEAKQRLTLAALHSEIFPRLRETQAKARWIAIREVIDELAPDRPARQREIAAANIRYFLSATGWNYFRFYFGFDLDDSIGCADSALRQNLGSLIDDARLRASFARIEPGRALAAASPTKDPGQS